MSSQKKTIYSRLTWWQFLIGAVVFFGAIAILYNISPTSGGILVGVLGVLGIVSLIAGAAKLISTLKKK